MSRLLEGVKVVEFGILFNGDTLGMLLGDLGAEIVKVEHPRYGDYLREMHGHLAPNWSPTHIQANKNKRSIGLDVRVPEGRELFFRLIEDADVFVDGLSTGACDRMGIGYVAQRARNPRIIYCQHSGFGTTGPYAALPTHGVMPVAIAGGKPVAMGDDGLVHPSRSYDLLGGTTLAGEATTVGSVYAAMHIGAALHWRHGSGRGIRIDVASSDAALASALVGLSVNLNRDRLVDHDGMPASDGIEWRGAKYQYYQTRDGRYVLFACMERKFWVAFCRAIGRPDLDGGGDAAPHFDYGEDDGTLRREVQRIFHGRTLDEWMALAVANDLPLGPCHNSVAEVASDPQFGAREIFHAARHPAVGEFTYIGQPAIVDGQPFEVRRPAPAHGEHTREILLGLGVADSDIARLVREGVAGP
ncbi:MAG: CaiB/BaiF CoA transferase family protein [Gammaproteobacteria bacterium]